MEHLQCAHRILRYVDGTNDRELLYQVDKVEQLIGYKDANWVGNMGDRMSTSGFAFSPTRVAIAWSSRKQLTIALSSTKAKYRGVEVSDPTMI